jgi:signal transduction histidine kinase
MSDSYKPHRPTAKRLLNQIGSKYAFSNQVLILFLIPAFGSSFVFEFVRQERIFLERLLLATVGYLAVVIPLLAARFSLVGKPDKSRPFFVATMFLLAGFLRGVAILATNSLTGRSNSDEELYRLIGAPVFTLVTLVCFTILASNYQRHRESLVALADERYRLQIRTAGIRTRVQIQREDLVNNIRRILEPAISKIRLSLTSQSSEEAISSLNTAVEDVVRPLSLEVAGASDDFEAESGKAILREKATVPHRIMLGEFIVPLWAATIMAIGLVASAFLLEDWIGALGIIGSTFLVVFSILGVLHLLTFKVPVHPFIAAILVPMFYGISLTPFYLIVPLMQWRVSTGLLHILLIFGVVTGAVIFAAQFSQFQQQSTTQKLKAVNQQLEILNAALRQELWLNRRRTASVLHGPIQAALYASAIRLAQTNQPTAELVSEVESDIQAALEKLNNPNNLRGEEISMVLSQITEIWSDVATIKVDLSAELEKVIASQPLASEALLEVSREFINNAIKHGKATSISLRVFRLDANRFVVELTDNGQGVAPGATAGFGSKLLSELTLVWNQSRVGDQTISYAEIVLGNENF